MFAPYCPTCAARVLLGTGRIVGGNLAGGGVPLTLALRCFCGTVVAHDAAAPTAAPAAMVTSRLAG